MTNHFPRMAAPNRPRVWLPLALIGIAALLSVGGVVYVRANRGPTAVKERDLAQEAQADLEKRNFRPLSGPLQEIVADETYRPIPTQAHPLLGRTAPDFTLIDTDGKQLALSERWKDGPVVLVFYYGYHCNHCVSQLFGLNKDIEKFRELGATVIAVSADPAELTLKRYEKYGPFAFPVLSDPDNKVAEQFAVFKPAAKPGDDGDLMHGTFLIERGGRIHWANRGDAPFTENQTLLIEISKRHKS